MLTVVFWDVQHGSAAYIRTPAGQHIVIDLGTGSYGEANAQFSPLRFLRSKYGVRQLDALVITHPHRDHLDDIFNLRDLLPAVMCRPHHLPEQTVLAGNRQEDSPIIAQYLTLNRAYPKVIATETDVFSPMSNGGVRIQQFTPYPSSDASNLNNHSLVTVLDYANSKILIPGDDEPPAWAELLSRRAFVEAITGTSVLLAPHHGRKSGYSSELFRYISPCVTVISDGPFCVSSQ